MNWFTSKARTKILLACASIVIGCAANAATEEATDKLLMKCTFKHRDTDFTDTGSYARLTVNRNSSGRLQLNSESTGSQAHQRFTLIWKTYSSASGNGWYILPGDRESCLGYVSTNSPALSAETTGCGEHDWWHIKRHDGYYIISYYGDYANSFSIASGAADTVGTVVVSSQQYNPDAALSARRNFQWEIRDCYNQAGTYVSPNFN